MVLIWINTKNYERQLEINLVRNVAGFYSNIYILCYFYYLNLERIMKTVTNFPIQAENARPTHFIEINGQIYYGTYQFLIFLKEQISPISIGNVIFPVTKPFTLEEIKNGVKALSLFGVSNKNCTEQTENFVKILKK